MEVQKPLLLWAVAQADRALTQDNSTLLLWVCSTTIPWLCADNRSSPQGEISLFFEDVQE